MSALKNQLSATTAGRHDRFTVFVLSNRPSDNGDSHDFGQFSGSRSCLKRSDFRIDGESVRRVFHIRTDEHRSIRCLHSGTYGKVRIRGIRITGCITCRTQ